jgi:hypothetical protein
MKKLIIATIVPFMIASTACAHEVREPRTEVECHRVLKWIPTAINGKPAYVWKYVCDYEYPGSRVYIPQ